ncbi:MAG: hypothetical protein CMK37_07825 [Porticoccaceae bacterium]|nr:hypothetical protein [Porticoccaceae bacterium]|tara:strand:- start:448 stop:705 length:258 start_codon:yes stop_codon:yes gene_type:complete
MTGRQKKIAKVMNEFEAGTLKSSSGEVIKDPRQAMAIALSEAGVSKEGKSDEYIAGYLDQVMGPGEKRCRGYMKKLASDRRKKKK